MKNAIEKYELKNISEVLRITANHLKLRNANTCLGRMWRKADKVVERALSDESSFNQCPRCAGTDLDRNNRGSWFDEENQTHTFEVECNDCGLEFEEVYKFIGSKFENEEKTK